MEADRAGTQKQREAFLAELRGGPAGVERWNARSRNERKHGGPYHDIDLSGARLDGVNLAGLDLRGASLEKSSLVGANLQSAEFRDAHFAQADLTRADLRGATLHAADFAKAKLREGNLRSARLRGTSLQGADLTGADASHANLCGADLTGAKLVNLALDRTEFDESTVWPAGFSPPRELTWRGKAADPRFGKPKAVAAPVTPAPTLTLPEFLSQLRGVVDPSRLANALQMLRAERFQLYSQVEDDRLVGVIRSQSSEERVYACKLTSDGGFSCGTQNLRVCGGLGGAICKHLLVLIVGLASSGQVNLGRTYQWVCGSRGQRPLFDKDEAAAVFLRYKGAEAGEIDWRPTETIPEDYHAL